MEYINNIYNWFKKNINNLKKLLINYKGMIFFLITFVLIDLLIRLKLNNITIARITTLSPNLFTLSYALMFLSFILFLKGKLRKIMISLTLTTFLMLYIVNNVYFDIFNSFFSFNSIVIAGEGTGYIKDVIFSLDIRFILLILLMISFIVLSTVYFHKHKSKSDFKIAFIALTLGIIFRGGALISLGDGVDPLEWNAWDHKKNVYDSYTESRKSLKVSGFFEYTVRDFYLSTISKNSVNKEEYLNYLTNYFTPNEIEEVPQKYRGLFKDKNVIVVLLESIDTWLLNQDTMPTLTKLANEGLNFTNHFSVIYGGGATFNSEFMINTGYMTPFNSKLAAYSYSENLYSNSLVNLFKKDGYSVNSFHFNKSVYYNRGDMARAFGYEKYHSALELGYGNISKLDSTFMMETDLKDLMLPEHKFMTFFTSYSAHMPYGYEDYLCKTIATKKEISKQSIIENENLNCAKLQAGETDDFFKLLIEALKEKGIYDDTVIIGITDHYSYTFPDQDFIFEQKANPDENFIHNVPFFIWSSDIEAKKITKVNSNLDVLPTIADLFDLDYNPTHYLGSNILSSLYEEFVFFADYSWFDGKTYFKEGNVIFGEVPSESTIINNNKKINNILDINSKVLETNYFSKTG